MQSRVIMIVSVVKICGLQIHPHKKILQDFGVSFQSGFGGGIRLTYSV